MSAEPSVSPTSELGPVRFVTAASLFDGHDAAINIMRRILQSQGAEVIHLGHDRSVEEIVETVVSEGAHAVAVSSYQGGHIEFFRFLIDRLAEQGAEEVRVFGGGGGTITEEEIDQLHAHGVARIFSPDDGRQLGLEGMIAEMIQITQQSKATGGHLPDEESILGLPATLSPSQPTQVARLISWFEERGLENPKLAASVRVALAEQAGSSHAPLVVGFTGTGGAGKSSVVDELVRRFRLEFPEGSVGLVLMDPTRRRSGGALLGDRIRMNAVYGKGAFVRSMATRRVHRAVSDSLTDALCVLKAAHFDLLLVETAGIGQSDSEIVDNVDLSLYVMTPEFGAPSQLEKIDMLELADLIVLNKCDRQGATDALRDIRKQWQRNHSSFVHDQENPIPVFGTVARSWNDPGTDELYLALRRKWVERGGPPLVVSASEGADRASQINEAATLPRGRQRYLSEVSEAIRSYRAETTELAEKAAEVNALDRSVRMLQRSDSVQLAGKETEVLGDLHEKARASLPEGLRSALEQWPEVQKRYDAEEQAYSVRGREIEVTNQTRSLSGTAIPKVAVPQTRDWGELTRFLRQENLPGHFPFTAGVFPFRREGEDPTRMFAGEGGPARTNRRFHYLAAGQPSARLSTAFDSVTLYGRDPNPRPDIYGKVGNSGVSVCTLDDAKILYSGFDLCDESTSVSLTINGPAPMVLAFFLNAAIDQQVEVHLRAQGELQSVRERFQNELAARDAALPVYPGALPDSHNGLGLGLLGIPGRQAVDAETYVRIRSEVMSRVRGTVQADILKEDQAQNTCIFSTDFALKMQGDIQEQFIREKVRNFYSVSISGYHMAEAGANPITQLAFTLANGLTFCEYYLSRGMAIDDFAANFSFFFSNGLDPEYDVIGRVARRIWAIAMRDVYGAAERSQKLKYHIQTSGRSLHAQEMSFNDIRTTLQALKALQDNCNSLHTNAYDEAVTTPTEESVRRALAIQLIINRELGTMKNENALQGSYYVDRLTDLVEEEVLQEFDRISERGGVLGAMETLYQRGKIQEESLHYESLKHTGELPIIGVNTFEANDAGLTEAGKPDLMRSSSDEKQERLDSLAAFHQRGAPDCDSAIEKLQAVAQSGQNVFCELMETVTVASLGQISNGLFQVGGSYRRSM